MSNGGPSRSSSSFHFLAGLTSGTFTAVLLQPADLLKTRVQQSHSTSLISTLRTICASSSPVRQLWRGTVPSALRTGIGSALYFGGLNALRRNVALVTTTGISPAESSSSNLPKLSRKGNLLTGAVARASAGFLMMPITVIKVRYESSLYDYRSIHGAGTDIIRREGLRGFFAGFGATAVRDAPYAGLYVLFYEESKRLLGSMCQHTATMGMGGGAERNEVRREGMSSGAGATINFTSGVLAAGSATLLTNPFDAIKTRLQLEPARYGNMVRAAKMMLRQEGTRSLFDGLALRMGRKAISSALAWTVYEELIRRAESKIVAESLG